MGGHAGGEIAAQTATETVARYIRSQHYLIERVRRGRSNPRMLGSLAGLAVLHACRAVYHKAERQPELRGMGCTLTVVLVARGMGAMAHVGDSRLYLGRGHKLTQLSHDHTVADEFVRMGLIDEDEKDDIPGGRYLARAVGVSETVDVDERLFQVKAGDRLVLCSDGVWGYLEDPEEMREFLEHVPDERAAESLVAFANSAGGRDNATALVITIQDGPEEGEPEDWRAKMRELAEAPTQEMAPVRAPRSSAASHHM